MRDRLVIVQRRLTHYRVPFFDGLRPALEQAGFDLGLVVGNGTPEERLKQDDGRLEWARHVSCRYALGGRVCWQSLGAALEGARFVVVGQENRLLANVPLLLSPGSCRVGLWGHGANFGRSVSAGPAQWLKRVLVRRADWCFAYTETSAMRMRKDAPPERVTTLNNTIDTAALAASVAQARTVPRDTLRRELGLGGGPVGLFLGSLYHDKRIDLLLDTAEVIRSHWPTFEIVIAGNGPLAPWLTRRAEGLPWVHRTGLIQGGAKGRWLAAADFMLNPGVVGLVVLDSFASGLPLVVGESASHPPEAAYLEPGTNCLLAPPSAASLADAANRFLADADLAASLREGCSASAQKYTLQHMIDRFVEGAARWRVSPLRRSLAV